MKTIEWDAVFKNLEKWRREKLKSPEMEDTAVTTVAEDYAEWPSKAWPILVSTIISLRTKDDVTKSSSRRLLGKAPNPKKLLSLGAEEIERLIYPAGFYRTKAANLIRISKILLEKYNGEIPADMDALLSLPGVGRKTANLVITEAFGMYGICVDIHVHRISNRMGWLETASPEKTEMRLREILPKRHWKKINGLLVLYGQNVCRPISPFCSLCVIKNYCSRIGVEKSR